MGEIARGADGRRLFTLEFKKQQIDRVLRGELTLAELTRELDVSPSVTRRWKRLFEQGSCAAVRANEEVVSVRLLKEAEARIRELERARRYERAEDAQVLEEIRTLTRRRDSYGYRRVTARVNRLYKRKYNEKRIRRVMRIHDLQIPPQVRRRSGRAHTGKVATDFGSSQLPAVSEQSNVRWCSDALVAHRRSRRRRYDRGFTLERQVESSRPGELL